MLKVIKKFFAFCGKENRHKFIISVWLSVFQAVFEALKIPAIAAMIRALMRGNVETTDILLSLGIMLVSIIGAGLIKAKATMLQTEGGYDTCARKRVEIAEHMRYLPMGYFNANSLGQITSVTTNVMENLENVATRVVMLVCEGLLTTSLIIVMLFFFDWRIALVLLAGFALFLLANSRLQVAAGKLAGTKISADEKLVEKVLEYLQGMTEVKAYHLTEKKSRELNDAIAFNSRINTDMEKTLIPRITVQSYIAKLTGVAMVACSCAFYCGGSMDALTAVVMVIANNIRFGQPDAPMEDVIAAAKKACCHEFISALPDGYDTVVGEGGASLSGGERQRISIARAMMKDAPVIFLDEATANVVPENENELMKAIQALTAEKTVIMIAHRLKTVEHADQILVVDHGRIVQQGTHVSLMEQNGIYKDFICLREESRGKQYFYASN